MACVTEGYGQACLDKGRFRERLVRLAMGRLWKRYGKGSFEGVNTTYLFLQAGLVPVIANTSSCAFKSPILAQDERALVTITDLGWAYEGQESLRLRTVRTSCIAKRILVY